MLHLKLSFIQQTPLVSTHTLYIVFCFVFESSSTFYMLAYTRFSTKMAQSRAYERLYSLNDFAWTSSIYFKACCIEGNLLFATRFECIFVVCNDASPPKDVENKLPSNMYKTPSL